MDQSLAIPFLSTSDAVFLGRHMKKGGEKWRHIQSTITKERPVTLSHLCTVLLLHIIWSRMYASDLLNSSHVYIAKAQHEQRGPISFVHELDLLVLLPLATV